VKGINSVVFRWSASLRLVSHYIIRLLDYVGVYNSTVVLSILTIWQQRMRVVLVKVSSCASRQLFGVTSTCV
jgi:hypothetical protein